LHSSRRRTIREFALPNCSSTSVIADLAQQSTRMNYPSIDSARPPLPPHLSIEHANQRQPNDDAMVAFNDWVRQMTNNHLSQLANTQLRGSSGSAISDLALQPNRMNFASSESPRPPLPRHLFVEYTNQQEVQFDESVTTLIIKNVPQRFRQARLAEIWPPASSWNILYLPWSRAQQRHVSYAFVNFVSNAAAVAFHAAWHGQTLQASHRAKPLDIRPADIQGYFPNLVHMYSKLVQAGEIDHARSKPIIIGPHGSFLDLRKTMASTAISSFSV